MELHTMNKIFALAGAVLVIALGVAGCSKDDAASPAQQQTPTDDTHNVIGKPLHEALDKAKQVEQTIQDGFDQREQTMKDQGI